MLGEMREKEILPDLQSALVQLGGIQLDMAGKLPTSDESGWFTPPSQLPANNNTNTLKYTVKRKMNNTCAFLRLSG